jgi:hypothetical protein
MGVTRFGRWLRSSPGRQARSHSAAPPRLFGQDFKVNAAFGIWALHAWVWKDNPSDIFADWNPVVTCAHDAGASTSMSGMAHH